MDSGLFLSLSPSASPSPASRSSISWSYRYVGVRQKQLLRRRDQLLRSFVRMASVGIAKLRFGLWSPVLSCAYQVCVCVCVKVDVLFASGISTEIVDA